MKFWFMRSDPVARIRRELFEGKAITAGNAIDLLGGLLGYSGRSEEIVKKIAVDLVMGDLEFSKVVKTIDKEFVDRLKSDVMKEALGKLHAELITMSNYAATLSQILSKYNE